MESSHLTILNLLNKEDLITIASTLLNENIALKTRLNDLESQVSQVVQVFQDIQQSQQPQPILQQPQPVLQQTEPESEEDKLQKRKLFVRNISFSANKFVLYNAFSKYGKVEHAKILYETNSFGFEQSKGYGFVIYENA